MRRCAAGVKILPCVSKVSIRMLPYLPLIACNPFVSPTLLDPFWAAFEVLAEGHITFGRPADCFAGQEHRLQKTGS